MKKELCENCYKDYQVEGYLFCAKCEEKDPCEGCDRDIKCEDCEYFKMMDLGD